MACILPVPSDASFCLPTSRNTGKQQRWPAQPAGPAATLPAPSTGECADHTCAPLLCCGSLSAADKHFIASLIKVIGNLGVLFVWNRKESERSDKQKTNESFHLLGETSLRSTVFTCCSKRMPKFATQKEIKLYCVYSEC